MLWLSHQMYKKLQLDFNAEEAKNTLLICSLLAKIHTMILLFTHLLNCFESKRKMINSFCILCITQTCIYIKEITQDFLRTFICTRTGQSGAISRRSCSIGTFPTALRKKSSSRLCLVGLDTERRDNNNFPNLALCLVIQYSCSIMCVWSCSNSMCSGSLRPLVSVTIQILQQFLLFYPLFLMLNL